MKRRMELEITLTFMVMVIVGVVIHGLYSVISMESNFFTFKVMSNALFTAITYLFFIWVYTRRHQLLTLVGILSICFAFSFIELPAEGIAYTPKEGCDWLDAVMFIYCIIAGFIAKYQAKKLLEEDATMDIVVDIGGTITPNDVEINTD